MRKTNLNSNVREQYVSPGMKILSLQSEGVLCGSLDSASSDYYTNDLDEI